MAENSESGRIVVITGGGSGIGLGMAQAFAAHGDNVVIVGRDEAKLKAAVESIGGDCSWQRADVSQREQVEAAVAAIVAQHGRIDVLINNAGYSRVMSAEMQLAELEQVWDEMQAVNVTGAFLMSMAAAPHLARPGGRIINISSDAALTGAVGLRVMGYAAAKAGLHGLTLALAREYSPQGITANVIAVGFVAGTGATGRMPEEIVRGVASQLPVGRAGRPEDIAAAALYLASPDAGFVTGEILNVNGGRLFGR